MVDDLKHLRLFIEIFYFLIEIDEMPVGEDGFRLNTIEESNFKKIEEVSKFILFFRYFLVNDDLASQRTRRKM